MASRDAIFRSKAFGRLAKAKAQSGAHLVKTKIADKLHFAGALVQSPRQTGAIAPTSDELANLMASHITAKTRLNVLELGPGTGSITRAILAYGLPASQLVAVEYERRFCQFLPKQFPGIQVISGDAFDLDASLSAIENTPFDCVISGLPLLNFAPEKRLALLASALDRLPDGRPFVQFSYGVHAPITGTDASVHVTRSPWVWKNLPPARVWTYCRPQLA